MTCTPRTDAASTRTAPLLGSVPRLLGLLGLPGLLLVLLLVLLVVGTGCGSSGDGDFAAAPQLGTPSGQDGLTAWGQSLRADDDRGEIVPGFANMWDLDRDFTIVSGGDAQLDGALELEVGGTPFPADQNYAELQFMTPEFGTPDGLVAATVYDGTISGAPVLAGSYSMAMAPTQSSRIQQNLDLRNAVTPIDLSFMESLALIDSNFSTEDVFVQVSIKNTSNGVLQTIRRVDNSGADVGTTSANLDAYAGQLVRLAIEARSTPHSEFLFDAFSVTDGDDIEYVTNGGFESGSGSGWTRGTPSFVRNVTSGMRVVDSLEVTRSFYAAPESRWARMVDVFTNPPGGVTIDRTVTYVVGLGASGEGIVYGSDSTGTTYATPDTAAQAMTIWDSTNGGTRDIGWAFGTVDTVDWQSDDTLGPSGNGNDALTVSFDISVPSGSSVALAHFIVLHTDGTGSTASSINDTADAVDAELQAILNGWPADGVVNEFTSGLTQAQIDAVLNF